jgi:2-polyprenyl-3-methyl-5-hydroxy-6-metoxy-1,4-benzoquinol methylase
MSELAYTWIPACENCGGRRFSVYGVAVDGDPPHPVQCRCRDCDLVFASPRLTPASLANVYATYYSEHAPEQESPEMLARYDAAAEKILRLLPPEPGARVLDVGAGTGAFMARARAADYEVHGVELSEQGVELARSAFALSTVIHGTLEDAAYADASFDAVVAWHLIEHVSGVGAFVDEVRRILRPGGIAVIGTEAHRYPVNGWLRVARFATGRVPRTVTSSLHTYVFSPASLRSCFERRGFETVQLVAYDEQSPQERASTFGGASGPRGLAGRAVAELGAIAGRAVGHGPYLIASFRRV